MKITIQNVEELIFFNKDVRLLLPEFNQSFHQWEFARTFGGMEYLIKKSLLDFINNITPEQIEQLSKYFNSMVTVDKLDLSTVKNYQYSLDDAEASLNSNDFFDNFTVHRDENQLYISFWR